MLAHHTPGPHKPTQWYKHIDEAGGQGFKASLDYRACLKTMKIKINLLIKPN